MHGNRCHIRSCVHGTDRKVLTKIQMGSMGFIHQNQHIVCMSNLYNGSKIRTDSIIGRIVHQHRHGIRIRDNRFFHFRHFHSQGNSETVIHLRVYINRYRSTQYQGIDHTLVYISWKNDLIPRLAAGKYHSLYGRGSSSYHEKSMIRTECFRRQLLCLFDHRYRMAEIVQRFHGIHIQTDTFFTQKFHQFRIPPPSLMPGHIEGNDPSFLQFFQRLIDRRMHLFFLIHIFSLLSFPRPQIKYCLYVTVKVLTRYIYITR